MWVLPPTKNMNLGPPPQHKQPWDLIHPSRKTRISLQLSKDSTVDYWKTRPFYLDVSENGGTPKSSIFIGVSIRNHLFWGTPIFGNTHLSLYSLPNSSWVGIWTHQHRMRRPLGVQKTPQNVSGGFWKTRICTAFWCWTFVLEQSKSNTHRGMPFQSSKPVKTE